MRQKTYFETALLQTAEVLPKDEVQRLKQQAESLRNKLYPQGAMAPVIRSPAATVKPACSTSRTAAENLKAAGGCPSPRPST